MNIHILSDRKSMIHMLEIPRSHIDDEYIYEHIGHLYPDEPNPSQLEFIRFTGSAAVYRPPKTEKFHRGGVRIPQLAAALIISGMREGSYAIHSERYTELFTFRDNDIIGHSYVQLSKPTAADYEYDIADLREEIEMHRSGIFRFHEKYPGSAKNFSLHMRKRFPAGAVFFFFLVLCAGVLISLTLRRSYLITAVNEAREEFFTHQEGISLQTENNGGTSMSDITSILSEYQGINFHSFLREIIDRGYPDIQIIEITGNPESMQVRIIGDTPLELQERLIQSGMFSEVIIGRIRAQNNGSTVYSLTLQTAGENRRGER